MDANVMQIKCDTLNLNCQNAIYLSICCKNTKISLKYKHFEENFMIICHSVSISLNSRDIVAI